MKNGDCGHLFDKMKRKMKDKIERIEHALNSLSEFETDCQLCPRECRVNRKKDEKGICQTGRRSSLSHALLHYGEEPVLSGHRDWVKNKKQNRDSVPGSGTIFFTGCNLKCLFCQNFQLSWLNEGRTVSDEELASIMLDLQKKGALNINLVSPTHMVIPILRALRLACAEGLNLPLVWNSNGYEKADILKFLEGIIDIYLPDLKYFSPGVAGKFSGASNYFAFASRALQEMYCQQPALILDKKEIAQKGLIIRHLILPGQAEDSLAILEWAAKNLSLSVWLSLMSQYHPCFKAPLEIQRPLFQKEYEMVIDKAEKLGFENLFIQPETFRSDEHLVPDFNQPDPFKWS